MGALIFNTVLRISGHGLEGFYRVVAAPSGRPHVWLAFMATTTDSSNGRESSPPTGSLSQASRATLSALEADGQLTEVELQASGLVARENELDDKDRMLWETRRNIMEPFFSHEALCECLEATGGIGPLVQTALARSACSRATVYRLWIDLCGGGFTLLSLMPRFDRCGAPGVARPMDGIRRKAGSKTLRERIGEPELQPQRGMTDEDRIKILLHYRRLAKPSEPLTGLYDRIIEAAYVTRYQDGPSGRTPVLPPQGTFPNRRQFRHAIEAGTRRIERLLRRTTERHFQRNLRGLKGPNYQGIVGPGHEYAIDSTIGDIHLRSSINRAWIVGRPIVYFLVDVWSTAIVGFYVCLSGPSWDTAKIALFSSFSDPRLIAELWGYEFVDVLSPAPTAPFRILCDRGEYLSAAARGSALLIGVNLSFNPSARPDLKGLVEVLHRIAKDAQYRFLPGAINARRRELELKSDPKESAMTMREYVAYLQQVVVHYNLFADREHRLTSEMIAAGVQPSPAGLWRFGHEAGLGYQKRLTQEQLIGSLLQQTPLSIRRDGVFAESLRFEGEIATNEQWTELARNQGTFGRPAFMFPGTAARIWTPSSAGMHQLNLSSTARTPPETTVDEWRDTLMYSRIDRNDREYKRLQAACINLVSTEAAVKKARALTAEADAAYVGPKLTATEARILERQHHGATPQEDVAASTDAAVTSNLASEPTAPSSYEEMMNDVFAKLNAREDVA